jgi:hypothetical protein
VSPAFVMLCAIQEQRIIKLNRTIIWKKSPDCNTIKANEIQMVSMVVFIDATTTHRDLVG